MLFVLLDESEIFSGGSTNIKFEIFRENFDTLCHTMTDIDDLIPFFVAKNIITFGDQEVMTHITKTFEKVSKLLSIIEGPLRVGDNNGFYVMLDIMKTHGTASTQRLAEKILEKLQPPPPPPKKGLYLHICA